MGDDGTSATAAVFDSYAAEYDQVLDAALAASGETKEYYARGRVALLAQRLARHCARPESILDFGCGTGTSISLFFEFLNCATVTGVDVSRVSLEVAASRHDGRSVRLMPVDEHVPQGDVDLVFCNGVFHHIKRSQRPLALCHIHRSLRTSGLFAFWENNPWNVGTRYCMRVNPFDHDANPISSIEARRMLRVAGFEIVETRYVFFFPRCVKRLRVLEPYLARCPLGGQYLIVTRKVTSERQVCECHEPRMR